MTQLTFESKTLEHLFGAAH